MAKPNKDARPAARLPKGLRDVGAAELRAQVAMIEKIRAVYERYGFEPLETPAFEYTDALGKFLPDQDRPNEGVFSLQDEDEQWLSLRYDLTAPLARYVAQNFQDMTKPFRRYAVGPVWRNEKPGPGRFRQFLQFDADTVGADSIAADAEMCMLAADTLQALDLKGKYIIKVNNRKVLDGVLELVGIEPGNLAKSTSRLAVLRALDKLDKFKWSDVSMLLGKGRKDESGDFTPGAGLDPASIERLSELYSVYALRFGSDTPELRRAAAASEEEPDMWRGQFEPLFSDEVALFRNWRRLLADSDIGLAGIDELEQIANLVRAVGYGPGRIAFNPAVVRGLEYYTGPVFEAELTFEVNDEKGNPVRFGSVGGGGRYDGLVERFTGQKVPATGFSIGVSRLQAALALLQKDKTPTPTGPVVVTVMEKERLADYQKLVQALRDADIPAELYLGNPKKFGKQLEYADKRGSPCVVIRGADERAKDPPELLLKDMIEGAKAAAAIADNKEWKEARPAQISIKEMDLVSEVKKILARHGR